LLGFGGEDRFGAGLWDWGFIEGGGTFVMEI
jgi:hypothetical protein